MYNDSWGGYPDAEFLSKLDPKLGELRCALALRSASAIDRPVGGLTGDWAKRTGLQPGIPVAVGAFDAHLGGVGSGIAPGTLVKIIGTSTCDMMVAPLGQKLADVPGLCGIVDGSILPGYYGLEAGQSAVGDIFNWFVNYIQPRRTKPARTRRSAPTRRSWRPANPACWRWIGTTATAPFWWTNASPGLLSARRSTRRPAEIYRALDRSDGFRRADHHQSLRGIRREGRTDRQLRRDRGEESARDADLCRRDGPAR